MSKNAYNINGVGCMKIRAHIVDNRSRRNFQPARQSIISVKSLANKRNCDRDSIQIYSKYFRTESKEIEQAVLTLKWLKEQLDLEKKR